MYEVYDVTRFSLHGYEPEVGCETLTEVLAFIGEEIESGMGERYTVRARGEKNDWNCIQIDARDFKVSEED